MKTFENFKIDKYDCEAFTNSRCTMLYIFNGLYRVHEREYPLGTDIGVIKADAQALIDTSQI